MDQTAKPIRQYRQRRCIRSAVMVCVLCLGLSAALYSQDQAAWSHASDLTTTTNLVIVPALVRTPAGETVQELRASDFRLTDNGVPQAVSLENTEHQPLAMVVLMQTGGSAEEQLGAYSKLGTMLSFVTANIPHEVALVEFDSQPEYAWEFTQHIEELEDGFRHPDRGDHGAAILDAVSYGVDLLRKQSVAYRRMIVLISQAHDDGSHVGAEEIIRSLGENNIMIECLTFSPEKMWLKDQFTKPRHENRPYQLSPALPPLLHTFNLGEPLGIAFSAMRKDTSGMVAALSGGESLPFSSQKELEDQLAILAKDVTATYTLSFVPSSRQPGFHSLHLHIPRHPELQVSARSSYWWTGRGNSSN